MEQYALIAKILYCGNPRLNSNMFLCLYGFIALADAIACNWDAKNLQIYGKHVMSIQLLPFQQWLAPTKEDQEFSLELFQYFFARRNLELTWHSLPATYAKKDASMESLRERLIKENQEEENKKRREVERKKEEHEKLQKYVGRHSYFGCPDCHHKKYGYRIRTCSKCAAVTEMENMTLKPMVWSIPKSEPEDQRKAVFYESMPNPILQVFRSIALLMQQIPVIRKEISPNKYKNIFLRDFWLEQTAKEMIRLGSITKSFLNTHFKSIGITNDVSDFILGCNLNCLPSFHMPGIRESGVEFDFVSFFWPIENVDWDIEDLVAFSLEKDPVYSCLQWTMSVDASHTQNQVLASQSDCSKDLSLLEWIHFDSLRSDGGVLALQLLTQEIHLNVLRFDHSGVLLLILQSLWQPILDQKSGEKLTLSQQALRRFEEFCERSC